MTELFPPLPINDKDGILGGIAQYLCDAAFI